MRNYFPKRPSGAPLHTLSKLYDVLVGFVPPPPYFEAEYCLFCGRRRVAVARNRMICLVLRKHERREIRKRLGLVLCKGKNTPWVYMEYDCRSPLEEGFDIS